MRGTLRGAATAWLGLIALHAVATGGSGKVAGAFADVNRLLSRVLDPNVPAIPDRRAGGSAGSSGSASSAPKVLTGSAATEPKTTGPAAGRIPIPKIPN
jgi:hypothetical protein